jgi:hypothetical protein
MARPRIASPVVSSSVFNTLLVSFDLFVGVVVDSVSFATDVETVDDGLTTSSGRTLNREAVGWTATGLSVVVVATTVVVDEGGSLVDDGFTSFFPIDGVGLETVDESVENRRKKKLN